MAISTAAASAATWAGVFRAGHSATANARAIAPTRTSGRRKSSDGARPRTLNGELRGPGSQRAVVELVEAAVGGRKGRIRTAITARKAIAKKIAERHRRSPVPVANSGASARPELRRGAQRHHRSPGGGEVKDQHRPDPRRRDQRVVRVRVHRVERERVGEPRERGRSRACGRPGRDAVAWPSASRPSAVSRSKAIAAACAAGTSPQ
jgi:hypothetical protein